MYDLVENNYKLNNDTIILAISDVHLGASKVLYDEFIFFLRQIIKNPKKLEVLVILGDFFDVIMESVRDFCLGDHIYNVLSLKYKRIFTLFKKLKNLHEINIFFALGNHEISILPDADARFNHRKKKLLKEFKDEGFKFCDIISFQNVCQYFLLNLENKKWKLSLYDNQEQLIKDEVEPVNFKIISEHEVPDDVDPSYNCLLAHGHQFETFIIEYGGGLAWYLGLKSPDKIKEIGNYIYNDIIKGKGSGTSKEITKWYINKQDPFLKTLDDNTLPFIMPLVPIFVKYIAKLQDFKEKLQNNIYIEEFKKDFLPGLVKNELQKKITHLIFGHTHKPKKPELTMGIKVNDKFWDITIANCGAWQQIDKPTIIEINNKGEFSLIELELVKKRKRKLLVATKQ